MAHMGKQTRRHTLWHQGKKCDPMFHKGRKKDESMGLDRLQPQPSSPGPARTPRPGTPSSTAHPAQDTFSRGMEGRGSYGCVG